MRERALTERAKQMRTDATEPEQRMWLALRAKRFGETKFRRQKVIRPYIADFASRDPMLVIEIDGDTHIDRAKQDAERTAYLEAQGYMVLRFTNMDVMTNIDGVLETLGQHLRTPPLPTLSPEGERAL
jgi:very-short-patch-repair endonuclease